MRYEGEDTRKNDIKRAERMEVNIQSEGWCEHEKKREVERQKRKIEIEGKRSYEKWQEEGKPHLLSKRPNIYVIYTIPNNPT